MKTKLEHALRNGLLFYLSIMIVPVVQFIIFYIIVNANSLMLSFKTYEIVNGQYVSTFVGFKNIINTFKEIFTTTFYINVWKNSILFYLYGLIGGTVFSLFFSYYIYKKRPFGSFFKIMLYLPHIVSTMVITILYKYCVELVYPEIMMTVFGFEVKGFGAVAETQIYYILFFNLIMSFGSNMMIYTGTMAGISDSIIEAAQIDGVNVFQEFFYVIMPTIFSTFALFIVTGMLVVFNGQGGLFNFYGLEAPEELQTFGYYMFVKVKNAGVNYSKYPSLASLGLALTVVAIPIVFTGRYLINKYGPSED